VAALAASAERIPEFGWISPSQNCEASQRPNYPERLGVGDLRIGGAAPRFEVHQRGPPSQESGDASRIEFVDGRDVVSEVPAVAGCRRDPEE
jgi:hypothetical protein